MTDATIVDLDLRGLLSQEHHSTIFALFDALDLGETLRLSNDRDLRPLHFQLIIERPGMFEWEPEQQGPKVWVIRIRKTASEK
jgi:uncharacterized protein (DUF2249 family)